MSESSTGDEVPGTGRLFRSLRAEGHSAETAVPALNLDEAVGLRTMTLGSGAAVASVPVASAAVASAPVASVPVASAPVAAESAGATPPSDLPATAGLRASGVWFVVLGVTVVMGFADALVTGQTGLGWLTGISLLIASIYAALVVRRADAIVAVIAPPLAFFLATVTAGQLTIPQTGSLLIREAFMIVTTLGNNAIWIFGSTLIALGIVLIRRRRSQSPVSEVRTDEVVPVSEVVPD
ncbi:MAG: hypothetical protein NWR17_06645 [Candidatus Nanopelagicales bacterium]|nr:hypothetical protein [Candidatus Nanopelagicales bacterium]MDP4906926.1 hypothetical protein [Candidatus Nanopelagicales bacterium]MDP4975805.1 hypothetical protein [Candidatus Nanopelagicales bacterium]